MTVKFLKAWGVAAALFVTISACALAAESMPELEKIEFDTMSNKEARSEIIGQVDKIGEFYQDSRTASKVFEGMLLALSCGGEINPKSEFTFDLTSRLKGSEDEQFQQLKARWLTCERAAVRLSKVLEGKSSSNKRSAVGLYWLVQGYANGYRFGYVLGSYIHTLETCTPDVRRAISDEIEAFKNEARRFGQPQFDADLQRPTKNRPLEHGGSCSNWSTNQPRYLDGGTLTEVLQAVGELKRSSGSYDFIGNIRAAEALDDRLGQ